MLGRKGDEQKSREKGDQRQLPKQGSRRSLALFSAIAVSVPPFDTTRDVCSRNGRPERSEKEEGKKAASANLSFPPAGGGARARQKLRETLLTKLRKLPLPLLPLQPESACSCVSARAACSLGEKGERRERRRSERTRRMKKRKEWGKKKKEKKLPLEKSSFSKPPLQPPPSLLSLSRSFFSRRPHPPPHPTPPRERAYKQTLNPSFLRSRRRELPRPREKSVDRRPQPLHGLERRGVPAPRVVAFEDLEAARARVERRVPGAV